MDSVQSADITNGISTMWSKAEFTDVKLQVASTNFNVHRNVLAAQSSYFYKLFLTNKAVRHFTIGLPVESVELFGEIINYAYTGELTICMKNLKQLLEAAEYLNFTRISELCLGFLEKNQNLENAFEYLITACRYKLKIKKLEIFILNNYKFLFATKEFLKLPQDNLIDLLSSSNFVCEDEVQVYNYAVKWLDYNKLCKNKYNAFSVLAVVRFGLLQSDDVFKLITDDWMRAPEIKPIFDSILDSFSPHGVHYSKNNLITEKRITFPPRVESLLTRSKALPDESDLRILSNLSEEFIGSALVYETSCDLDVLTENFEMPKVGNYYLFVTNGYVYSLFEKSWQLYQFDAKCRKWKFVFNVIAANVESAVFISKNNYLYIIGGRVLEKGSSDKTENTVTRFDLQSNVSTTVSSLPVQASNMAGCHFKDSIFVTGGKRPKSPPTSLLLYYFSRTQEVIPFTYRFDENNNSWKSLNSMLFQLHDHLMVTHEPSKRLFVFGGYKDVNRFQRNNEGQYYSVQTDQWTRVTGIPNGLILKTAVSIDESIYFLSMSQHSHGPVQLIKYSTEGNCWQPRLNYPSICVNDRKTNNRNIISLSYILFQSSF